MHCLSNLIIALLAILPFTFAYLDQPCNAGPYGRGFCAHRNDCKMYAGQLGNANTYEGYRGNWPCPNDASDVVCCAKIVKRLRNGVTNVSGRCLNTRECSTSTVPSYECPGSSNVKLCIDAPYVSPYIEKIYQNAKANVGETAWAKINARQCKRNSSVYFNIGEWKCNLFVYEVLLASGVDIGTPNQLNSKNHPILAKQGKLARPPCASDWYNETVSGFTLVGSGDAHKINWKRGDIITDGDHVGIVSDNNQVISASTNKVLENDWGFRSDQKNMKIFRCMK